MLKHDPSPAGHDSAEAPRGLRGLAPRRRGALVLGSTLALGACAGSSGPTPRPAAASVTTTIVRSTATSGADPAANSATTVRVALILRSLADPYMYAIAQSAERVAAARGVILTVSAASRGADGATQSRQIEQAIAAGQQGLVITPDAGAVDPALYRAKQAGVFTIALGGRPRPPNAVDLTYATDGEASGRLDGRWAASKLEGSAAEIALISTHDPQAPPVEGNTVRGFLAGLGGRPRRAARVRRARYRIGCRVRAAATITAVRGGLRACLKRDPAINLVYATGETAAEGAALASEGWRRRPILVASGVTCSSLPYLRSGAIGAETAPDPRAMGTDSVEAIYKLASSGIDPSPSHGLGFYDTGSTLYTDEPTPGVPSLGSAAARGVCWG